MILLPTHRATLTLLLAFVTSFVTPSAYATFRAAPTVCSLRASPQQQQWLREANINLQKFIGKPADEKLVNGVLKKFVRHCETSGYPFARAQFDSVHIDSVRFDAALVLSKGSYIVVDSLVLKSDGKVRASFLRNHLGLRRPRPYSEEYVEGLEQRINELGFVGCTQPPAVEFRQHSAKIYAYVDGRKANRANALVAFGTDENGDFQLSGEASLFVANMFKGGEELGIDWCGPQKNTQLLHAHAAVPYLILGTVGVKAQLDMERRDTLYMSIGGRLGLLARVGVRGEVTLFAEWQQHNGASRVSSSGITLGGAELRLRRTDSPLFPRRGYDARVAAALGSRRLDEGLSTLAELGLDAWQYVPMGSRISLAVRLTGEAKPLLSAAPSLLQSEQYTIGGAGILRGFAERSVFASSYAMVTVEPRYFVGAQGYLHAFYDVAACDRDWLHGFGVGAKLAAAAGIFSISVALGGQLGGSIAPANAKVHVGYVAVF